ncbi:MAG: D-Ala-D-Ala carboxypeptidase family metallohydrolase [bacterium]|nr:D-Ala-D-Ala carboxypeptidase family metallohydrolase [bacterium]
MLLTRKKRQEYLKYLGYYNGEIDGIVGSKTRSAYKKLQNDFFVRKEDKDGLYGNNTDLLLRCAYNVKKYTKNFKLTEFRCKCKGKYCTCYPSELNKSLLIYLQDVRNSYGSINITSGLRCKKWNEIQGGTTNSKHIKGKAVDFTNKKVCKTFQKIKEFINEYIKNKKTSYIYSDGYARTKKSTSYPKAPNMKKSIHMDVI